MLCMQKQGAIIIYRLRPVILDKKARYTVVLAHDSIDVRRDSHLTHYILFILSKNVYNINVEVCILHTFGALTENTLKRGSKNELCRKKKIFYKAGGNRLGTRAGGILHALSFRL